MVAQMATDTEIDAARLLVYRAAWAKANYFAGETVTKCANYTMRILGA